MMNAKNRHKKIAVVMSLLLVCATFTVAMHTHGIHDNDHELILNCDLCLTLQFSDYIDFLYHSLTIPSQSIIFNLKQFEFQYDHSILTYQSIRAPPLLP